MQTELSAYKKDYEEWSCLYLETTHGQISYHIPNKYLPMIEGKIRQDQEYVWDGHSPLQASKRLEMCAKTGWAPNKNHEDFLNQELEVVIKQRERSISALVEAEERIHQLEKENEKLMQEIMMHDLEEQE